MVRVLNFIVRDRSRTCTGMHRVVIVTRRCQSNFRLPKCNRKQLNSVKRLMSVCRTQSNRENVVNFDWRSMFDCVGLSSIAVWLCSMSNFLVKLDWFRLEILIRFCLIDIALACARTLLKLLVLKATNEATKHLSCNLEIAYTYSHNQQQLADIKN